MTEAATFARMSPLVGRDHELALLTAAVQEATSGRGRVVLLCGDAGLGKSRLVRELAALVRGRGERAAFGAAYADAAGRTFGPVIDLLRNLRTEAPAEARDAAVSAASALNSNTENAGAGTNRWAQIDAVEDALGIAAGAQPPLRLVVIEDLHWADASTVELLTQVLRRVEGLPLLVAVTLRPPRPDGDVLIAFTDSMRQLLNSERIELGPIPVAAGADLVRASAGTDLDDASIAAILVRGEGNPFFLEEAARDAARAAREGQAPPTVPLAVRDLVQRRAAALSPAARDVAAAFATLGEPSNASRIAPLVDLTPEATAAAIDTLIAEGFLTQQASGEFGFRHALARDAIYESLPASRCRELHERCAHLIESEMGDRGAAVIARHLEEVGGVENERRAGTLLALAGEQSLAQFAHEQAAEQLAAAIRLMGRSGTDASALRRVRLRLAEAQALAGVDNAVLNAFAEVADDAAATGDVEIEAAAAIGYEGAYVVTGRPRTDADARSIALLDRALTHLEQRGALDGIGARVLAASAQARFFAGRRDEAVSFADRAAELARACGDDDAEAAALDTRRTATWGPEHPEERLHLTRLIVERASAARRADLQLAGLYWQVSVLLEQGLRRDADAAVTRFGEIAERIHHPYRLSEFHRMRAMMMHLDGHIEEARAESDVALALAEQAGNAEAHLYHTAMTLSGAPDSGNRAAFESAGRVLESAVAAGVVPVTARALFAYFHLLRGDRVRAASLVETVMPRLDQLPRDGMWLPTMAMLAEVVAEVSEPAWARTLYDQLLPFADQYIVNSNAVCYGSVERLLGQLATALGLPEAEAHRRRGIERNAAIGTQSWLEPAAAVAAARVTKTFMFTDIVKSTSLVEAMGDEAWEVLLRWHNQTLGELFSEYGGEQVVSTGDGFFVAFETADAAIDCAIAIQRRLAEHRRTAGFAPQVRIGVHETDATEVDANYHGRGVHEAARISALAEGGEILASTATAGSRATLGPARTEHLKGIAEPVEIVALAWR